MNLLIKNGLVIDAYGTRKADVAVEDGIILSVEQNIEPGAQTEVVDASGLLVLPGAIDVHTHFELPFGDISSADDFYTGTKAAACGGVTTVVDFVTPEKGENLVKALEKRKKLAKKKVCIDYSLHMGLSEVNNRVMTEMADVVRAGVPSFKVFMTYASRITDEEFARTLTRAKELNAVVMVHAEAHNILERRKAEFLEAGKTDAWFHYLSRPEAVETKAVKKAIELAKKARTELYIVHLASEGGLKAVKEAQNNGYPIFAETCPQYLNFTNEVYKRPDGRNFVCSPSIKGKRSQDALWNGVRKDRLNKNRGPYLGVRVGINTVATDHCPFNTYEKDRGIGDFTKIPNGVMGVENLYPYMLSEANKGRIEFERVVMLCSVNPARIFNLAYYKGAIYPNHDADIVLYDPDKDFKISQKNMHSNIDYTIWEGVELKGYPVRTYSRGKLIYKDGEFLGNPGHGKFIYRSV